MTSLRGIYLVAQREGRSGESFRQILLQALAGGLSMVQLRAKHASTLEFIRQGKELMELLAPWGVPLIINDRVDVALALGAPGVHIGQSDMPWQEARKLLGPRAILGLSVETQAQLDEAAHCPGLSYLALSAVFPSPTKKDLVSIWGLEGLKKARGATALPLVAIGGINEENAEGVFDAGADMIALVSAVMESPDPGETVRRLRRLQNSPTGETFREARI